MSTASNKDQTGAISTGAEPSKRAKQAVPLPCENVGVCGTRELEAPSSIALGVCLRCRGFYTASTAKERERIWNERTGRSE